MRLNASKFGLFASLLGAVAGQETTTEYAAGENPDTSVSSGSYITFETLAQQNIFRPQEGDAQIKWVANVDSRLEVKEVRLHKQYKTGDNDTVIGSGEVEALADTSTTNGKRVYILGNGGVSTRQTPETMLPPLDLEVIHLTMNEFSTNLTIASEPTSYNQVWNDKILYLEVVSENKTSTARSYSPGFIVLGAEASATVEDAARDILDNWSAQPSDTIEGAAATTTAADPTSTSTPTSTSQTSADADASLAENGGGGGSGLSPGAIAGIAVGVAVGALAIAGVLAWFFCFRRRRRSAAASSAGFSRAHEGPYGAGSGAAVMMTEKEAAGLAESRDRPSLTQDRGINGGGAAAGTSRAYAPYSDDNEHHIPGMAVTTTGTDSQASLPLQPPHYQHSRNRSAATASPSPIESRYAHLIEEGMTEDEIRRLEEEERQLDAAIEEAGSGSNNNNGGSGGKR